MSFLLLLLLLFLQEVQRNGKASIPAGRWPSLLSLTCPRSSGSGSGSELSLSSACSEYSSGSHTWAEGRGSSKQVGFSHLPSIQSPLTGVKVTFLPVSLWHVGLKQVIPITVSLIFKYPSMCSVPLAGTNG